MTIKIEDNNSQNDSCILPVATAAATNDSYGAIGVEIPVAAAAAAVAASSASFKAEILLPSGNDDNEKKENKKYGYDNHPDPLSSFYREEQQSNNYSFWGRFNDPQATVLPTNNTNEYVFDIDNEALLPVANARLDDRQLRHQFIRRVYFILIGQLFITFGMCAMMTLNETVRHIVLNGTMAVAMSWTSIVSVFVLICFLTAYKRSYPLNMILLFLFTIAMSYLVGTITALYAEAGVEDLVLEALFITFTVFAVLTVYTLQSKHDFSFMRAGLGMSLWVLILWGIFASIFGIQPGFVYGLLGSIVFSGYIIYDTYMLAERHDPRDYVLAAVQLYLDIINLFLYILQLLSYSSRSG